MAESREVRTLRMMAWARAKGELAALMETYWDNDEGYTAMRDEVDKFIKTVEDNALQE